MFTLESRVRRRMAGMIKPCLEQCRGCGAETISEVLDLGRTPLADRLVRLPDIERTEKTFPLQLLLCRSCSLLQLDTTVPPATLFDEEYPYFSSVSSHLVEHARRNVENLERRFRPGSASLVVEIASNDGYLLQHFRNRDVPVLGIEPSGRQAQVAREQGIPTIDAFFSDALAAELAAGGDEADIIVANNVLAHVPAVHDFIAGLERILKPDGTIVVEVPYAIDLVRRCEFDTIYHQHVFYFTMTALRYLFGRHGLHIQDMEQIDIHGGSLRFYAGREPNQSDSVDAALDREEQLGVAQPAFYREFADTTACIRRELPRLLARLRGHGASIVGYGAAAKAATLLNTCGIDAGLLDYIVDLSPWKQDLFMTGCKLPIHAPDRLLRDMPDYVLLLAWNFEDEIRRQQSEYLSRGGRFIRPLPYPHVAD